MKKLFIILIAFLALSCSAGRNSISKRTDHKYNTLHSNQHDKVLYLVNDRQVTLTDLESMDPNLIESIEVIKDVGQIRQYTSDDYDGLILITLKKTEQGSRENFR